MELNRARPWNPSKDLQTGGASISDPLSCIGGAYDGGYSIVPQECRASRMIELEASPSDVINQNTASSVHRHFCAMVWWHVQGTCNGRCQISSALKVRGKLPIAGVTDLAECAGSAPQRGMGGGGLIGNEWLSGAH